MFLEINFQFSDYCPKYFKCLIFSISILFRVNV